MSGLRIIASRYDCLVGALLDGALTERCAIGFASVSPDEQTWVLDDVAPVPADAYVSQDEVSASLTTAFVVNVANRARLTGSSPVLIHTHPHAFGVPHFSQIDERGEAELKAYFDRRVPAARPLALVIGSDGARARRLGTDCEIPVWTVGAELHLLSDAEERTAEAIRHDRQIRAFGAAGQGMVARLKILTVGAGGTGSLIDQQLAYLGAKDVTSIDPDTVDETNLNRLVGATPADVGSAKVEVARRTALAINPDITFTAIMGDIVDAEHADRLADFDFIFLCTDSHASRAVVNQAAYQYLIPVIDMGVSITAADSAITHVTGRVQMLSPGEPCLTCTRALDGEQIRREILTPQQRAADTYIVGVHEPQPAVISINSTMASLAVTMFLGAVTPVPAEARFQLYDGLRGTVRPTAAAVQEKCIVCSPAGALAKGFAWPLPSRPRPLNGGIQ